jgi:hypothetical protein
MVSNKLIGVSDNLVPQRITLNKLGRNQFPQNCTRTLDYITSYPRRHYRL